MGKKSSRQAARVAAAMERDEFASWRASFARAWLDIGERMQRPARPRMKRGRLAAVQLLAMAMPGMLAGCSSQDGQ